MCAAFASSSVLDFSLEHMPPEPARKDYAIGVVGSGFIMRDVQLVAYQKAGFNVQAITSRDINQARETAAVRSVPHVYTDRLSLLHHSELEVIDIAVPPDQQPAIIYDVLATAPNVRGILAQKPLAMNYGDALSVVRACEDAGVTLAVNQNMRYDQSIRALKTLLNRGALGEPVFASIEMRAIPHWQSWIEPYGKLTLLAMSIHHLDCFRYLFGSPDSVYCSARPDPRTRFPHTDGITLYILEYNNGMRASAWDDVWTGPAREGGAPDCYIKWRVEGTTGMAQGTIGWPEYPNAKPSTIEFTTAENPRVWFRPTWNEVWFPDAFSGTMGNLLDSLARNTMPAISGHDNLDTMALVDACYASLQHHRPVSLNEIKEQEV
jgi:predicted dehydrogenase